MTKKLFFAFLVSLILIAPASYAAAEGTVASSPFKTIELLIQQLQEQVRILQEELTVALSKTPAPAAIQESIPTETASSSVPTSPEPAIAIVTSTDATGREVSNPNSSLPQNTTITVLNPNGGETWTAGVTYPIRWHLAIGSSSEAFKTTILLQSAESSIRETKNAISATILSMHGENQLAWTIPDTISSSSQYRIYVQLSQLTYVPVTESTGSWLYPSDESNANFSISAPQAAAAAPTLPARASIFSVFSSFWKWATGK